MDIANAKARQSFAKSRLGLKPRWETEPIQIQHNTVNFNVKKMNNNLTNITPKS